jgi:hypothetical protein
MTRPDRQYIVRAARATAREAIWYATEWTPSDDSLVQKELGIAYRDIRETLGDSILWPRPRPPEAPECRRHIRERARGGSRAAGRAARKPARRKAT